MHTSRRTALAWARALSAQILALGLLTGLSSPAAAAIAYVQSISNASGSSQSSISATFTGAQTAGNLIVVAVGWSNGTGTVSSVTDTRGNTYALAIGPTVFTGAHSSSIYYAKNIVSAGASANTVTVTFNSSVPFPDLRMAEYSGLDTTNPLDVTAGATGTGTACNSGSATTTSANDLLIGANDLQGGTTAAGTGYTQRELSSNSHILEDRIVSVTGSYSATATQDISGKWVMQMAAFRAPSGGGDTQAPTAPTGLTANAITSSRIDLSWTASTDNVGVTGYRVERCQGASCSNFAEIATPGSTSFSDTGLSASTTYRYRVRAADAVPNLSGYSSTASATTSAGGVSIAYVQSGWAAPGATPVTSVPVTLSASQAAGNLNVVAIGWDDPTFQVSSVTDTRGNTYAVAASPIVMTGERAQVMYYAKNIAAGTNTVTVTFTGAVPWPDLRVLEYSGLDTTAPLDVSVANSGNGTVMNSGSVTTSNANDLLVAANTIAGGTTAADANFTQRLQDSNLNIVEDRVVTAVGGYGASATQQPSSGWVMQMVAFKAAGGGGGGDTQAPSTPTGLTPNVISSTQINVSWTASTDNVGVTGYRVERCAGASCSNFAEVGTPTGTSFNNTGLTASTTYRYRVRATDAVPNFSAYSSIVSGTTQAAGDTQAPTAPSSLTSTVISSSQVNLSWTASTDNVGVTAYLIERCSGSGCSSFLQIDSISGTTYSDTTVAASTTYVYRVRARDAANNLSGYSNTASATIATALGVLQGNSGDPQTPTPSAAVTFSGAQTAGDTNVIAIGWRSPTVNIQSVTDSRGNTYMPAVGPTILPGVGAHAIYFSSGIVAAAAGANTVTVTFSGSVSLPDVRIAEYGGIDTSEPIDSIASATGSGTTSSSGSVATITANTLIVGANLSTTTTTGPGTGFTTRSLSSPDGDILEDRTVSSAGTYSATAPLSASGQWIMQLVAFRWVGLPCN